MSQDTNKIQALYEDFITNMRTLTPKIDAILLLKAMRLEKMFVGDLPHVHLEIDFTDDRTVFRVCARTVFCWFNRPARWNGCAICNARA